MILETRQQRILEMLESQHIVQLQDLMTALGVSESTIRRDLSQLESLGQCIRVHGGAKRAYHLEVESTFQQKIKQQEQAKQQMAQAAAELVQEQSVIYLDAGTSTYAMVPYLSHKEIVVVTNGIQHADALTDTKVRVILIGGELKAKTRAIIGSTAIKQLQTYRFDQAFMGMNGVDAEWGYTTPDAEESAVKQQAFQQASQVYVLADSDKIGKVSFSQVAPIEDAILLTNSLTQGQKEPLQKQTIVKEC